MIAHRLNRPEVLFLAVALLLLNLPAPTGGTAADQEQTPPGISKTIHLAAGQIVCRPGDIDGNLEQIHDLATGRGGRRAAVPVCRGRDHRLRDHAVRAGRRADGRRPGGGTSETAGGRTEHHHRRRHARTCRPRHPRELLHRDARRPVRRATQTPDQRCRTEGRTGSRPAERTLFEVDGVRMAVCICADVGIPDIRDRLAEQGCQVLLLLTAGGGGREHIYHPDDLHDPQRLAGYVKLMDNVCSVTSAVGDCVGRRMAQVAVNLSGDDGMEHYHPGHSSIIDSRGRIVALLPGEYVIDYLAAADDPRPGGRAAAAGRAAADVGGQRFPSKVLRVSRTPDFEVNGRGDAPAWEKARWEPLQLRAADSHPYQTRVKVLYSAPACTC